MWKDILKQGNPVIYVAQFLSDLAKLKDKNEESFIVGHTNNDAGIAYMRLVRAAQTIYMNLSSGYRQASKTQDVKDLNQELEEVLKGKDGSAFTKEFKRELVALVEDLEKGIDVEFEILRDRGSLDLYL
tara:strand:- start:544 stop:930 length:387 start_codon:yes stop_codon:yes gene_type:complete